MAEQNWRDLFVGRENDLAVLQSAWHKAKAMEPQVVCLIAESGLGKTRLVQEFFGWLSTNEDAIHGNGYWPDRLDRQYSAQDRREALSVNPAIRDCVGDGRSVPYLWWGIKLPDPFRQPNSVATALADSDGLLKSHLRAYLNAAQVAELKRAQAWTAGNTLVDIGLNFAGEVLPEVIKAAIPGSGIVLALASTIKGLYHTIPGAAGRQKQITQLQDAQTSMGQFDAQRREDIADVILHNLTQVCSTPPDPLEKLPLVLVIDDAQWIKADLSLCKLLADLLTKAGEQKWPLLVVVTCWEAEWRVRDPIDWGGGSRERIEAIFDTTGVALQAHPLEPALALDQIVTTAFPGLTPAHVTMILDKAEGNAMCLYEILFYLEKNAQLFEARDKSGDLSAQGALGIAGKRFEEFVEERLASTPEYVQAALGLASLQGMQFSSRVVDAAAERIAMERARDGLVEGENPHAFIRSEQAELGEFRARYYQRAADKNLHTLVDRDQAEAALRAALETLTAPDEADGTDQTQLWQAQLALFGSADEAQGSIAYEALYQLAATAYSEGDLLAMQGYSQRWAQEWLNGTPGSTTVAKLIWMETMLREAGNYALALAFSENVLPTTRKNLAAALAGTENFSVEICENELCMALERLATNLWHLGRYKETLEFYREAFEYRSRRYAADPSDLNLHNYVSAALQVAGGQSFHLSPKASLPSHKDALDLAQKYAAQVRTAEADATHAVALQAYGSALTKAGQNIDALTYLQQAIALGRNQQVDSNTQNDLAKRKRRHEQVLRRSTLLNTGDSARKIGSLKEALSNFVEGLQLVESMPGSDAELGQDERIDDLLYTSLFAERIYEIETLTDPVAALPRLESVLAMKRELVAQRPDFNAYNGLRIILLKLGAAKLAQGHRDEAATHFDETETSLEHLKALVSDISQAAQLAEGLFWLGDARRLQGRLSEAIMILDDALEQSFRAAEQLGSSESARTVSLALERLAMIAESEGETVKALEYLLACMAIKDAILADSDGIIALNDHAIIGEKIVSLYAELDDGEHILPFLRKLVEINSARHDRGALGKAQLQHSRDRLRNMEAFVRDNGVATSVLITPWQAPAEWLEPAPLAVAPAARNAPCPCGSGERYKHCHGK